MATREPHPVSPTGWNKDKVGISEGRQMGPEEIPEGTAELPAALETRRSDKLYMAISPRRMDKVDIAPNVCNLAR
jgi:hypothetical protein